MAKEEPFDSRSHEALFSLLLLIGKRTVGLGRKQQFDIGKLSGGFPGSQPGCPVKCFSSTFHEEPPDDLTPAQKAAFRRQQTKAKEDFDRRQAAIRTAFENARRARNALISGKRSTVATWWATQHRLTTAVLQTLGVTWRPRLSHAAFASPFATLRGPLVQVDQSPSLSPNYIETLLAARDLTKELKFHNLTLEQPPPHTLLHLLLRHSMLLEYSAAATRLLLKRGVLQPAQSREPELIDMPLGQLTQTVWRQLATKINVAGEAQPLELSKYLLGFVPSGEPDVAREPDLKTLSEFRSSLAHLKSLSVNRLEALMTGTLDLCSHRLDAWITSFATKRLAEMRKVNPTNVLFGGYGWVMNLKPAEAQSKVAVPGEQEPVFQLANNPGFFTRPR